MQSFGDYLVRRLSHKYAATRPDAGKPRAGIRRRGAASRHEASARPTDTRDGQKTTHATANKGKNRCNVVSS
jgi:hypothetical protein